MASDGVCRYFLLGKRSYGALCRNRHPSEAQQTAIVGYISGLDGKEYPCRPGDEQCPDFSYSGACQYPKTCWYDRSQETVDKVRKEQLIREERAREWKREKEIKEKAVLFDFLDKKEESQGPEWKQWVEVYNHVERVVANRDRACYVVVDVASNSGTTPTNPSLIFTCSRDLHHFKKTIGDRLVRTYSWRTYQRCSLECYEKRPLDCSCGARDRGSVAERVCVCEAEGQVVGRLGCKCTAVSAQVGARAAAKESGRHVVAGPVRPLEDYPPQFYKRQKKSYLFATAKKGGNKKNGNKKKGGKKRADSDSGSGRQEKCRKHDTTGMIQCPSCSETFDAPTLESRYDDDVNFYPSETRGQHSRHYYAKHCGLIQHIKRKHTKMHWGTNTWGGGGKRHYRDSTDEDEEIDLTKEVTGGKSREEVTELMLDVASVYRSRKVDPPGGWPVRWSDTLTATAKEAVDVWAKREGRIEAVWSETRACKAIKDDWLGCDDMPIWPHMEERLSVRDIMRRLARKYSKAAWEDDVPPADKKLSGDTEEGDRDHEEWNSEDEERNTLLVGALENDESGYSCDGSLDGLYAYAAGSDEES